MLVSGFMKIGLDFDGVITDCAELKSLCAKELFGVSVPSSQFKKEYVVGNGILTLHQYLTMQKKIYGTQEYGLKMKLLPGVQEYLSKILHDGHDIQVITSRGIAETAIAQEFLDRNIMSLPLIGVGGESKAYACYGLDVYIDDDIDKLEDLMAIIPFRYLMNHGYNSDILLEESVGKRVSGWVDFYREIQFLAQFDKT